MPFLHNDTSRMSNSRRPGSLRRPRNIGAQNDGSGAPKADTTEIGPQAGPGSPGPEMAGFAVGYWSLFWLINGLNNVLIDPGQPEGPAPPAEKPNDRARRS